MVTSSSTPGSVLREVICLTISEGLCTSMCHLWIFTWRGSHLRTFTTRYFSFSDSPILFQILFLYALSKSAHTFSRDFAFPLGRVKPTQQMATTGSTGVFQVSLKAMTATLLPEQLGSLARANSSESGAGAGEGTLQLVLHVFLRELFTMFTNV